MDDVIATDTVSFVLEVSLDVYNLHVCKKACYALMGLVSCEIDCDENNRARIEVTASKDCKLDEASLRQFLTDELLDYSLREEIGIKTENIRNIILSNAFSNTKLVG